jgi:hypothetical protein
MARNIIPTDPGFLDEHEWERTWSPANGISPKGSKKHRDKPNGLPYLEWAGKIFIHKKGGAAYIRGLVKQNKTSRRSRRSSRRAEIETTVSGT